MDSAFARVLAEASALFGAGADTLLTGQTLIATPTTTRGVGTRGRPDARLNTQLQTLGPLGAGSAFASAEMTQDAFEAHFARWFSAGAGVRMSEPMRLWSRPVILLRDDDARVNADAYEMMATHEYRREGMIVARQCINGSIAACVSALGLVAGSDTLGAWLDGEARRQLAATITARHPTVNVASLRQQCMGGDDDACRAVLRFRAYLSPTTSESRLSLIRQALVTGGPFAFDRLTSAVNEPIARQLEIAAGIPLDSLVTQWRAGIMAARPRSGAPSGAEFVSVLLSGAIVVGLAVRRRPS
jgi:hypothetical protein